jgi:hypothetical protein
MQRYAGALLFVLIVAGSSACSSEDDTASACSSCGTGGSGTGGTGPDPAIDGYCRDKTPALIAAAGDPVEPVAPLTEEPVADSSCNAVVRTYPIAASPHVAPCNPVEYDTNPPTSGNHYGNFPRYAAYDYAIPRGFWVHSLEHGAVVLAYSCTDCQGDVLHRRGVLGEREQPAGLDPRSRTFDGVGSGELGRSPHGRLLRARRLRGLRHGPSRQWGTRAGVR